MSRARRADLAPAAMIAAFLAIAWGGPTPPPAAAQAVDADPTTLRLLRASLDRVESQSPRYKARSSNVFLNVLKTGLNAPRPAGPVRPGLEMVPGPLVGQAPQAATPDAQADLAYAAIRRGLPSVTGANPPAPADLLRAAWAQDPNPRAAILELTAPRAAAPPRVGLDPSAAPATPGATPDPTAAFFDWRFLGVVRVPKNQGQCGCCWAFGSNGAFEAAYAIRNNYRRSASEQYLLSCNGLNYSCNGGWWAFDSMISNGVALMDEDKFQAQDRLPCPASPGTMLRAVKWGYVSAQDVIPTPEQLKAALCTYGPLAVAVNATPNFLQYSSGVFSELNPPGTDTGAAVNHAVTLVGWDDAKRAWAIKNSWDTDWGQDGFMDIAYGSNSIGYGAAWVQAAAADAPAAAAAGPRGNGSGATWRSAPAPAPVPVPIPVPGPTIPEVAPPPIPRDDTPPQDEVTPPRISTPKVGAKRDRDGG